VGGENTNSQYNDNCRDSLEHKILPARSSFSKEGLIRTVKIRVAQRIINKGAVATGQLNFCSCFGTTHFDLRRPNVVHRRGAVHVMIVNFRTRRAAARQYLRLFGFEYSTRDGLRCGRVCWRTNDRAQRHTISTNRFHPCVFLREGAR
jgi:hypothetical protein